MVASMPPYCLGQCGAAQPRRYSSLCQGWSSRGLGLIVRRRTSAGRLPATHAFTSVRNRASASESRRNIVAGGGPFLSGLRRQPLLEAAGDVVDVLAQPLVVVLMRDLDVVG